MSTRRARPMPRSTITPQHPSSRLLTSTTFAYVASWRGQLAITFFLLIIGGIYFALREPISRLQRKRREALSIAKSKELLSEEAEKKSRVRKDSTAGMALGGGIFASLGNGTSATASAVGNAIVSASASGAVGSSGANISGMEGGSVGGDSPSGKNARERGRERRRETKKRRESLLRATTTGQSATDSDGPLIPYSPATSKAPAPNRSKSASSNSSRNLPPSQSLEQTPTATSVGSGSGSGSNSKISTLLSRRRLDMESSSPATMSNGHGVAPGVEAEKGEMKFDDEDSGEVNGECSSRDVKTRFSDSAPAGSSGLASPLPIISALPAVEKSSLIPSNPEDARSNFIFANDSTQQKLSPIPIRSASTFSICPEEGYIPPPSPATQGKKKKRKSKYLGQHSGASGMLGVGEVGGNTPSSRASVCDASPSPGERAAGWKHGASGSGHDTDPQTEEGDVEQEEEEEEEEEGDGERIKSVLRDSFKSKETLTNKENDDLNTSAFKDDHLLSNPQPRESATKSGSSQHSRPQSSPFSPTEFSIKPSNSTTSSNSTTTTASTPLPETPRHRRKISVSTGIPMSPALNALLESHERSVDSLRAEIGLAKAEESKAKEEEAKARDEARKAKLSEEKARSEWERAKRGKERAEADGRKKDHDLQQLLNKFTQLNQMYQAVCGRLNELELVVRDAKLASPSPSGTIPLTHPYPHQIAQLYPHTLSSQHPNHIHSMHLAQVQASALPLPPSPFLQIPNTPGGPNSNGSSTTPAINGSGPLTAMPNSPAGQESVPYPSPGMYPSLMLNPYHGIAEAALYRNPSAGGLSVPMSLSAASSTSEGLLQDVLAGPLTPGLLVPGAQSKQQQLQSHNFNDSGAMGIQVTSPFKANQMGSDNENESIDGATLTPAEIRRISIESSVLKKKPSGSALTMKLPTSLTQVNTPQQQVNIPQQQQQNVTNGISVSDVENDDISVAASTGTSFSLPVSEASSLVGQGGSVHQDEQKIKEEGKEHGEAGLQGLGMGAIDSRTELMAIEHLIKPSAMVGITVGNGVVSDKSEAIQAKDDEGTEPAPKIKHEKEKDVDHSTYLHQQHSTTIVSNRPARSIGSSSSPSPASGNRLITPEEENDLFNGQIVEGIPPSTADDGENDMMTNHQGAFTFGFISPSTLQQQIVHPRHNNYQDNHPLYTQAQTQFYFQQSSHQTSPRQLLPHVQHSHPNQHQHQHQQTQMQSPTPIHLMPSHLHMQMQQMQQHMQSTQMQMQGQMPTHMQMQQVQAPSLGQMNLSTSNGSSMVLPSPSPSLYALGMGMGFGFGVDGRLGSTGQHQVQLDGSTIGQTQVQGQEVTCVPNPEDGNINTPYTANSNVKGSLEVKADNGVSPRTRDVDVVGGSDPITEVEGEKQDTVELSNERSKGLLNGVEPTFPGLKGSNYDTLNSKPELVNLTKTPGITADDNISSSKETSEPSIPTSMSESSASSTLSTSTISYTLGTTMIEEPMFASLAHTPEQVAEMARLRERAARERERREKEKEKEKEKIGLEGRAVLV